MSFNVTVNNKVRQSNNLIESPYAQEFTAYEIKIFEIAVAFCTQEDMMCISLKSDKEFSISNSELAKLLNTKPNVISMEIEKTAARIMRKTMHLRKVLNDGTIEFEMINIIPFAKYKNGIFQFRLNYSIIPYLLEINKNFTEYQLHFLLSLSSAYSIKLYKLLYQYKNIKVRVFSIDELRDQFGIIDKYPQYKNFKQRIIDPSILQINSQTDLSVSYNEIKLGRKVEKLEFIFEVKKASLAILKQIEDSTELTGNSNINSIDSLLESIETETSSTTKDIILKYYNIRGIEYIRASISYAKQNAKSNLDKYLMDTLINGWAEVAIKKNTAKRAEKLVQSVNVEQRLERERLEKEQENLVKSGIEHEWSKLSDTQKQDYINLANFIIKKYYSRLTSFIFLEDKLFLSVYAISNAKFYDRMLESYIKNVLNVSLDIQDHFIMDYNGRRNSDHEVS